MSLQQLNPRRWGIQRQTLPPAPGPDNPIEDAWNKYDELRGNYATALSQIDALHDICREQSHRVEVLETIQSEERLFYQNEIDRLTRQRDVLATFSSRLETRLTAIHDLIGGAMREALQAADEANLIRSNPDQEETEVRHIVQSIANANPREDQ